VKPADQGGTVSVRAGEDAEQLASGWFAEGRHDAGTQVVELAHPFVCDLSRLTHERLRPAEQLADPVLRVEVGPSSCRPQVLLAAGQVEFEVFRLQIRVTYRQE
jgi:hypothetical protein